MTSRVFLRAISTAIASMLAVTVMATTSQPATLQGSVRDADGKPVAGASVSLFLMPAAGSATDAGAAQVTHSDSAGRYRFVVSQSGTYSLRAASSGYDARQVSPVILTPNQRLNIDLILASPQIAKRDAKSVEFYDEPQFTVAGVTQATNSGGHGSDNALRTSEALARATVSLGAQPNREPSKEPSKDPNKDPNKEPAGISGAATSVAIESSLRETIARDPENFDASRRLGKLLVDEGKATEAIPYLQRASALEPADPELHHMLGDAEEKLGNPLDAVREYQRAAELDPSEINLFDWGTDLLTHRALEPATEVFAKGNHLFPKSMRILVALGVAWYARGSYDRAAQSVATASDLEPGNPTPYVFLGRMQSAEVVPAEGSIEKLARFARLQPDNALANYYYAVALSKQSESAADNPERAARVEALLAKAVQLDPNLGPAYLQLGIFYSQRADFQEAIPAYKRAIGVSSEEVSAQPTSSQIVNLQREDTLEAAHYRLAQAYLRTGDKSRAQAELQLHDQLVKKRSEDTQRERREIQEFVISLRDGNSGSKPRN